MDDEATLDLVRAHTEWGVRPGARVIFHHVIASTGADPEAFGRYVLACGGEAVQHGDAASYWLLPDHL